MAEMVVNLVIQQLVPLIVQEVNLLGSVKTEVESIRGELEIISPFLKHADARAAEQELQGKTNEAVQKWVQQVREQAYRIEDCIDEFTLEMARLPRGTGLVGVLQKSYCSIKKWNLRRRIVTDIQDIKSKLVEIKKRREDYSLISIEQGSTRCGPTNVTQLAISSYYMDEDQIVGHESTRKELYDQLVNGTVPQRRVIALVGGGGLGKTTLAANVYKNKDVKNHFNCHAWIDVGKTYNKEDLLKKIMKKLYSSTEESAPGNTKKSAPGNTETMDVKELIDTLRKYLENKSYLVMFDDVRTDEFWKDVEPALIDNNKSSRLLITTRNTDVADVITTSIAEIHTLECLPLYHARQLFCRETFSDGVCPLELDELSNKIIEKCGGLPLAVVAVSGLLSKKNKIATEWQKLLNNLGSELGSDPHLKGCNRVLSEGYNDLPHHLKPCLLYFGLFPESYSISCAKLIRLWIAEGFIQFEYGNNKELEEIGEGHLNELIQRNLVQVSERDPNGRAKTSRVHDLMHEIILKKTEQMGFSRSLNEHDKTQCRTARRFTIHKSTTTDHNVLEKIGDSKVRSIFLSNGVEPPELFMNALFVANFKLMKVLDFEDAPIDHLPRGVGNLFHLHYLSLTNTKVKTLPKSIGKLLNLETLDLKGTLVSELPVEIKNLKKLRYLLVYPPRAHTPVFSSGGGTKFQKGLGSLMDLRKLGLVQVNSEAVQELKKLRQLRKLGICVVDGNGKELCPVIANMEDLKSLYIELMNRGEILDIGSMTSPPKYLERLYLRGNLKKLPDWIPKLQNLVRVGLFGSGLSGGNDDDDPMKVLRSLPNLAMLYLVEAYNGEQVHIQRGWFPKLKDLHLIKWKGLKSITIEDGGMPLLERLLISATPLLKEIPNGVENLKHLTWLQFYDMLEEIRSNPMFLTLERWEKLQYIPKFIVSSTGEGGERIVTPVQDILDRQLH